MVNLLGPGAKIERQRVLLFSQRLDGLAMEFWVSKGSGKSDDWALIDLVQALEANFLPLRLYKSAKERFDHFKQRAGESIQSVYLRLQEYSDAMLYEASPYEMKYRFFYGIHDEIRGQVAHDDCTPEKNRWSQRDTVKLAQNIKEGLSKGRPRVRQDLRNRRNPQEDKGRGANQSRGNLTPNDRPAHRETIGDRNPGLAHYPPVLNTQERPALMNRDQPPQDPVRHKTRFVVNRDVGEDRCRKCHKKGHWAQDCHMLYVGNAVLDPSPLQSNTESDN